MEINKEKILVVKNLTVKYGLKQQPIIKNFNLEIDRGDHLALIGPSGCGKTTFAKTLVNILPEKATSRGYLSICSEDPRKIITKKHNYLEEKILDLSIKTL